MIRQLREKQNREVGEYNNAINRQVLNKMQSQIALWESDRPASEVVDFETVSNYEETVKQINNNLLSKIETIKTVDLNNSGSEKQYKEIIDDSDFINKYNLLVKPLNSGNVLKKVKSAIENLVQPLQPLIEQITLAFSSLVKNKRAVGISRINPILTSYSLFDLVKQQFKNNNFAPISYGNLQSYYTNIFITKLGPSIVDRLKEALDEYNKYPSLRKEAMASQVGRLSPEELKGILKIEGINEYPISTSIGIKPETTEPTPKKLPQGEFEEETPRALSVVEGPSVSIEPTTTPTEKDISAEEAIVNDAIRRNKRYDDYVPENKYYYLAQNLGTIRERIQALDRVLLKARTKRGKSRNEEKIKILNAEREAAREYLKIVEKQKGRTSPRRGQPPAYSGAEGDVSEYKGNF